MNSANHSKLEAQEKAYAAASSTVIEEIEDPNAQDYNYEVPLHELDPEELKQLSFTVRAKNKKLPMVIGLIAAATVLGLAVGYGSASASASSAELARKSGIAKSIQNVVKARISGFEAFALDFSKMSPSYQEELFNRLIRGYAKHGFMLDITSDITAESVLLAGDSRGDLLAKLRDYGANSMLLTQLLSVHVNETQADAEELKLLSSNSEAVSSLVYAMQIYPEAVYYLQTDAPRTQYANGVMSLYTLKGPITDDATASERYSQLKVDNRWSEQARARRDYVPQKGETQLEGLDLPNRLLYEVIERNGRERLLFADDIILIDRVLLFGNAVDALARYNRRVEEIAKVMDQCRSASEGLNEMVARFVVE